MWISKVKMDFKGYPAVSTVVKFDPRSWVRGFKFQAGPISFVEKKLLNHSPLNI